MATFGEQMSERLKKISPNNLPVVTGIAWYKREDYDRCMAIFDDAEQLPDTYDEWVAIAGRTERDLAQQQLRTVRVFIDPETFPKWCADNGFKTIDKDARMHYGNLKAAEAGGIRPRG